MEGTSTARSNNKQNSLEFINDFNYIFTTQLINIKGKNISVKNWAASV
jgi:hypothetical protein